MSIRHGSTVLVIIFGISSLFSQGRKADEVSFDYEMSSLVEIFTRSTERREGVEIIDITYASPRGGEVTGFLIKPSTSANKKKKASVIFLHPGPGDRRTFLDEALMLAKEGVISLLIDAPFRRPEPWRRTIKPPTDPLNEREMYVQTVVDLRRGVDALISLPEIDQNRIAFVGHSFGSTQGGVLAGIEGRIRCFVLIAGRPSLTNWLQTTDDPNIQKAIGSISPDAFKRYLEILRPLDSVRFVQQVRPSKLFIQLASNDESVLPEESKIYERVLDKKARIVWYPSDHQGVRSHSQAVHDRSQWLKGCLRR